jgi:hypothetical protein
MYDALGYRWGNSFLGLLTLAMAALPVGFYIFDRKLRNRYTLPV